jgi:dolichol-phosphate mannosyltransferase
MHTLVIVPTYNELPNLKALVQQLLAVDPTLDVLIVDDDSPDGTGRLADLLVAQSARVHVLHREGKLGLGTAYVAGFSYALRHGYDRVVEMDADFSHRPEDLPRLLAASEWADVVIGSRNVPGGQVRNWSPLRQTISKLGSRFARTVLRLPIHDCTSGFKVFRRETLERLDLPAIRSNGYAFQVEVNYACAASGQRFTEVPIIFPDRVRGASKMSWRIVVEALAMVLRLRLNITPAAVRELAPSAPILERVRMVSEHETTAA